MLSGCNNQEISNAMHLSLGTVKNYVSNGLMKLSMRRRTEAAVYAARHGVSADASPTWRSDGRRVGAHQK